MKRLKVLHIMNGAATGGISKVVLGICQSLVDENFSFDIAIDNPEIGFTGHKLRDLGCRIIIIPRRREISSYCKAIKKLVQNNRYDFIHIHLNESSTLPLILTKIFGQKKVFIHAHTARTPKGLRDHINFFALRLFGGLLADKLIACSTEAGKSMYGARLCSKSSFTICKNYIDADKYLFNSKIREQIRGELGCNKDTLLIGCIGTLREEKNNIFSVKVFEHVLDYNVNAKLVFVGDGNRRNELVEYISNRGLNDKVILVGNKENVTEYLSSFDCFLMPSLYEGFPVAALEAIASGLPVVLSDTITKDLCVFTNIYYLSLNTSPQEWAKTINLIVNGRSERSIGVSRVKEKGFDYSSLKSDYISIYS